MEELLACVHTLLGGEQAPPWVRGRGNSGTYATPTTLRTMLRMHESYRTRHAHRHVQAGACRALLGEASRYAGTGTPGSSTVISERVLHPQRWSSPHATLRV
jgi:hypothetical protein